MGRLSGIFRLFSSRKKAAQVGNSTTTLGRIKNLVRAEAHGFLTDEANPSRAAKELMVNYDSALAEARHAVQEAITSLRVLQAKQAEDSEEIGNWESRAELAAARSTALAKKDPAGAAKAENMALKALKSGRNLELRVEQRRPLIEQQQELVDGLTSGIEELESRRSDLQDRYEILVGRENFAKAQSSVAIAVKGADSSDSTSQMAEFEQSVKKQEAMAIGKMEIANSSIEAQFRELDAQIVETDSKKSLEGLLAKGITRGGRS